MHLSLKAMVDNWNIQDERANRVAIAVVYAEGFVTLEDRKGKPVLYEDAILVHQRIYDQYFAYYMDNGKIKQSKESTFTKRESF